MQNKKVHIRSYNKVWKIENKIYAIQNIVLPVPVYPREVLYFFIIAAIIFVLNLIIPAFRYLPTIIKYVLVPYSLTQFLLKKKLDGKMPQKYFVSWITYMLTKNQCVERFIEFNDIDEEKIKISWLCSRGNLQN